MEDIAELPVVQAKVLTTFWTLTEIAMSDFGKKIPAVLWHNLNHEFWSKTVINWLLK